MKIVKGKNNRDVEEIRIWDGPCANEVFKIEKGRPMLLIPTQGETPINPKYIYFTDRAFNLGVDMNLWRPLEYRRTNREDGEGRVYFAMKQYV